MEEYAPMDQGGGSCAIDHFGNPCLSAAEYNGRGRSTAPLLPKTNEVGEPAKGGAILWEAMGVVGVVSRHSPIRHPGPDPGSRFLSECTPSPRQRDPGSSPG